MALDTIPKQEGGKLKAVASGTLPSGQPVVVNSDGTVSVVEQASVSFNVGSEVTWETSAVDRVASAYDEASGKVVIIYNLTSSDCFGIVGTVSGDSISFGSSTSFYDRSLSEIDISYDSTNSKVIVTYKDDYFYNYGAAVVGTVSGTSISFGTRTYFHSGWTNNPRSAFDSTNGKVVILFHRYDPSPTGNKAVLGTVSGTSISFESYVTNSLFTGDKSQLSFIPEQGCFLAAGSGDRAGTITVSGTSLSFGTAVTYANVSSSYMPPVVTLPGTSKAMIVYEDADNSSILTGIVATVDGTSVTLGSAAVLDSSANGNTGASAVYDDQAQAVMVVYTDYVSSVWGTYTLTATVSGDTITANSRNTIDASVDARRVFPVYDTVNKKVVVSLHDASDGNDGKSWVITNAANPTNLTSENYIGMSGGVVSGAPQSVGSAVVFESAEADQMSAVYDADTQKVVIVYRDRGNSNYGTAIVGTVSETTISFGTAVVFESASSYDFASTYDANAQKIVVTYTDGGNSAYGTAIVGTVSGTSISFGSATVFKTANASGKAMTYDSNAQKVVVAYRDLGNSDQGSCNVGTVSGTSISFGSDVIFEAASTNEISATFDSSNNKVVIVYSDEGNSNYGTAIVGTVSGTSISFGTAVVFETATATQMSAVFDSNSNKVVVPYKDAGNSFFGTAIVGTVSGTSISFGTAAVFQESNTQNISAVFDSNTNKVIMAYRDGGESDFGKVIEGTVSGTSISFGSALTFESSRSEWISAAYDTASQKTVIAYQDYANSQYGNAIVFQTDTITRGSVADGDAATVDIVGTVSTNQVGLTAGQQYYVQTDGTIGTTPADPSVLAGTAVSATKMVVKS